MEDLHSSCTDDSRMMIGSGQDLLNQMSGRRFSIGSCHPNNR